MPYSVKEFHVPVYEYQCDKGHHYEKQESFGAPHYNGYKGRKRARLRPFTLGRERRNGVWQSVRKWD